MDGYVYYTNKLSSNLIFLKNLENNNRIKFIKHPINDIQSSNITNSQSSKIVPHDYQIKAKDIFINNFNNGNRGILSMPCGTGKTFTSYLISQNYNKIIIISPLKQFAKQNLNRYLEYSYKNNYLLINSDK